MTALRIWTNGTTKILSAHAFLAQSLMDVCPAWKEWPSVPLRSVQHHVMKTYSQVIVGIVSRLCVDNKPHNASLWDLS